MNNTHVKTAANYAKKFLKINIDFELCYFNFGLFLLYEEQNGTASILAPSRSWLNLYPPPLLRLLDVDSYFLVKLFSLLFEPLVTVLSVYGESKPARPVLIGFELQDNIVRPKRMIVPYRMQIARISVRLHRKQRFGPLLVQPDILAVIFPFQQPLYIGTQLIDTHQGFYDLLCFLFKVGHLFIVSGLHGLDLLLQLPDALILVGNYPLQICNLFFIPRGLGVVE